MTSTKYPYLFRLQHENYAKMKVIAERERRSIAIQMELALEDYIARYEQEHGPFDADEISRIVRELREPKKKEKKNG